MQFANVENCFGVSFRRIESAQHLFVAARSRSSTRRFPIHLTIGLNQKPFRPPCAELVPIVLPLDMS